MKALHMSVTSDVCHFCDSHWILKTRAIATLSHTCVPIRQFAYPLYFDHLDGRELEALEAEGGDGMETESNGMRVCRSGPFDDVSWEAGERLSAQDKAISGFAPPQKARKRQPLDSVPD